MAVVPSEVLATSSLELAANLYKQELHYIITIIRLETKLTIGGPYYIIYIFEKAFYSYVDLKISRPILVLVNLVWPCCKLSHNHPRARNNNNDLLSNLSVFMYIMGKIIT